MQAGREELSGMEETELAELEPVEEQQEEAPETEPVKESAKETVRKELEKLKNQPQEEAGEELEAKNPAKPEGKKPQQQKQEQIDPDLVPPERLPEGQKALFAKLPKGLKREANKLFKSMESSFHEYNKAASATKGLMDAIQPYVAEWGMRGISPAQGVAQLAAAQAKLTDPDPAVRKRTFLALAKQSGVDLSEVMEAEAPKSDNAEIISLREQLQELKSYIGIQRSTQAQSETSAIVQELESVRQEVDETSGDYRYPELHNDDFLQQTVKPLVSAIKGTVSGISWADALRRAYAIATNKPLNSNNGIQTRFPAAEINKQPARAIAPVTVRGRSLSMSATSDSQPPPEAMRDARATAAWALEQLRRGR